MNFFSCADSGPVSGGKARRSYTWVIADELFAVLVGLECGFKAMPLNLDEKKAIVTEVRSMANDSLSLVIADARGVNVGAMTSLRSKARSEGVELRVVRNTLARRAFADTEYACVEELLVGPSLFAFSMEDPGAGARIFKEFSKENEDFEIKALSVGGKLLGSENIDVLANLPTLEQALGMLASVALTPVINIVRTLNEVPTQVTRAVAAIRDQKGEAA